MSWVTEHAPHPDDLNSCVQCGLCLPSCPTFRLTGLETASPRGRLTAMSAIAAGRPIDQRFDEIMGTCLQCRACEVVCPSFVPFGKAMEGARAELAVQMPGLGRRLRRLVTSRLLRKQSVIRMASVAINLVQQFRLEFLVPPSMRGALAGLRPLAGRPASHIGTTWHAVGERRGVAALVAGCVMDQWFGGVHVATVELLTRSGYEVTVPASQTCCGALAAHDGWADDARDMAATNVVAFEDADIVVVDAAGCSAHMKEYGLWAENGNELGARVVDVTEVVAEAIADGRLPRLPETDRTVAVQDPCHLRHVQRITHQPRKILEAAGLRTIDIDPDGRCCGAAGVYSLLEPELSGSLGTIKAEQIQATGSALVSSANAGCELQIRNHLTKNQVDSRVAHPVEFYWEVLRSSVDQPVGG